METSQRHRVVIIGGGFGGLNTAKGLGNSEAEVTLVDRRNFHLFQPLLYQVASGALSPGDIAAPLRSILHRYRNTRVLLDEVIDIDPVNRTVILRSGPLPYDTLVLAAGGTHQYFGHQEWQQWAPGLKFLEDAVRIRSQVLSAFESAEVETDLHRQKVLMTFMIIGGGPTGVEMAGALAELANHTLKKEFSKIDPANARILLVEAGDKILAAYPDDLAQKGIERLKHMGVEIRTKCMVQSIEEERVKLSYQGQNEDLEVATILWTAGVKTSGLANTLVDKTGCAVDRGGRIVVQPDFTVPGHPEILVIGDLCSYTHTPDQKPLPGLAAVAMQEGYYAASFIRARIAQKPLPRFQYTDKGNLAIIGRNAAIAQIGKLHLSGFPAWLMWLLVHIFYLIGFESKVLVLFQWAWNYATRSRSACLITEQSEALSVTETASPSSAERLAPTR